MGVPTKKGCPCNVKNFMRENIFGNVRMQRVRTSRKLAIQNAHAQALPRRPRARFYLLSKHLACRLAAMSAESEEKTIARIHECFSLFDRTRNSSCDERDVGTIIRSLGLNPSEKQARARPDEEVSRAPTMKKKIPSLYVL